MPILRTTPQQMGTFFWTFLLIAAMVVVANAIKRRNAKGRKRKKRT